MIVQMNNEPNINIGMIALLTTPKTTKVKFMIHKKTKVPIINAL